MVSKEIYKIFCSYIINSNDDLHLDDDSYGHEYIVNFEKNICGIKINIKNLMFTINKYENIKIRIDIILEFEELYNDNSLKETCLTNEISPPLKESSALLFIPGDETHDFKVLPLRIVFREIFLHIFRSFAIYGRSAKFFEDFVFAKYPFYNVKMIVNGNEVDFGNLHTNFAKINIRRLKLNKNKIENILNSDMHNYEFFITLSDRMFNNCDLRGAITNLTTAMEVAAYEFSKKIGQVKEIHFNPEKYFRKGIIKGSNYRTIIDYIESSNDIDDSTYFYLNSLWNTRHEIVHNGTLLFRDGANNKRDIDREDYYKFRSALSIALVWMGLDPIEWDNLNFSSRVIRDIPLENYNCDQCNWTNTLKWSP